MSEIDPSLNVEQSLKIANLEKLNLEIDKLKGKRRWQDSLGTLIPLISVLVAFLGFVFGIYQYRRQLEKNRALEEASQQFRVHSVIREEFNEILQFPQHPEISLAKVRANLEDMKELMRISSAEAQRPSATTQDEERKFTAILVRVILDDCNFSESRQVSFVFSLSDHWNDYMEYLKYHPELVRDILIKYRDGLTFLYEKAPCYVRHLKYSDDGNEYIEPDQCPKSERIDIRHFEDLVDGFAKHKQLLTGNADLTQYGIKIFQAGICNEVLTKQEFGINFDMKSDPFFKDCYKRNKRNPSKK